MAVLGLLMCLERQEVGVRAAKRKGRRRAAGPLLSIYADFAMSQWRGERRQRMLRF